MRLIRRLATRRVIEAGRERRATWLELFFDLVFAAAIAETAGLMRGHFDPAGLLAFLPFFLLIWWAWVGHTVFSTRFDSDDTVQRLLTAGQMFLVAVMAANAHDDLSGREAAGFAAAFGGMRLLLALQYLRCTGVDASGGLAGREAVRVGSAAALWIGSSLLPAPARSLTIGAAILVDLLGGHWADRGHRLPLHESHLPERFGLFILIVLGQLVASVMNGMRHQPDWAPGAAAAAVLGLGLALTLWWLYFGVLRVPDPADGAEPLSGLRLAAHLPLCLGIVVASSGIEWVVTTGGTAPAGPAAAALLAGSLLAIAAPLALFTRRRQVFEREPAGRPLDPAVVMLAGVGAAAAGLALNRTGAVWVLAALTMAPLATLALLVRGARNRP
ncbi:MAG: low temperature requirement protein A [Gemmatimonadales bacterium]